MLRTVGWVGCVVLVVAGAVVHGAATHRWNALAPDPARAEAAHALAVSLADYSATDVPSSLPVKENSRVTCRQYTAPNRPLVVVSVTSGPAGAVSTHTPDVCYPSSGYTTAKAPRKETIDLPGGGTATYLVAEFEKRTATTLDRQRIRWGWSADGTWTVPDNPRIAYCFPPRELYKLYVVTAVAPEDADKADGDSPAVKQFVAAAFAQYGGVLSGKK